MGATKTKFYKNKFASEFIFIKFCAPQKSFRKRNDFCSAKKNCFASETIFFAQFCFASETKLRAQFCFASETKLRKKFSQAKTFLLATLAVVERDRITHNKIYSARKLAS